MQENGALSYLHPLCRQWFQSSFESLTEIQSLAWPQIAAGKHVLLSAPTGNGKTLAAFFWALNQLISENWQDRQIHVLYVSPLKALNRDISINLQKPLDEMAALAQNRGLPFPEIHVGTRSGDTPQSERQKMLRKPPHILVTTPESLNLMLTSPRSAGLFSHIKTVIVDEIHAMAGSKRGVHCFTAIERLVLEAGEFQRIGLSATVNPMSEVASLLGGYKWNGLGGERALYEARRVKMLKQQTVHHPEITIETTPHEREKLSTWWDSLAQRFEEIINSNRSTLFFTDSRRMTEKIARLLNDRFRETVVYAHHGSLSRELRRMVETKLKRGELKALVSTSTLELGIDIGEIDEVVMVGSPSSVASAIQRIGRSRHQVGKASHARIFPLHGMDFIKAAALYNLVNRNEIEPLSIPCNAADVLTQIVLSCLSTRDWYEDDLYGFVKSCRNYHDLSPEVFRQVVQMLGGRFEDRRIRELQGRIFRDEETGLLTIKDSSRMLLYLNGGTITDRANYELRQADTGVLIGELDEEFVWERSVGDNFSLGSRTWKITEITDQWVKVIPRPMQKGMFPFWKADPAVRSSLFSGEIRKVLDELKQGGGSWASLPRLENFTTEAIEFLSVFFERQLKAADSHIPGDYHVTAEHLLMPGEKLSSQQLVIHTFWGGQINVPYALALKGLWAETYGYPLTVFYDDDSLVLHVMDHMSVKEVLSLVTPENVMRGLKKGLESSPFFGARFRECASIALLLPRKNFKKRTPHWMQRIRSKKLLQAVNRLPDFPVTGETWRTCLKDDFDLDALNHLLRELEQGLWTSSDVYTEKPSPFSSGILWQQTNYFMYEDDNPDSQGTSLTEQVLKDMMGLNSVRPEIPPDLNRQFSLKRSSLQAGYIPDSLPAFREWLRDMIFLSGEEWRLFESLSEEATVFREHCMESGQGSRVLYSSHWNKDMLLREEGGIPGERGELFLDWLASRGIVSLDEAARLWNCTAGALKNSLAGMAEEELVLIDRFTENAPGLEIVDPVNLEILLRWMRKGWKTSLEPLSVSGLMQWWMRKQHVADSSGDLIDVMDSLLGFTAPAELWEQALLPVRMRHYQNPVLDSLLGESPLLWQGNGKGKIRFILESDTGLYKKSSGVPPWLPAEGESRGFWQLKDESGLTSEELETALWNMVWKGELTGHGYHSVRRKTGQGRHKSGPVSSVPSGRKRLGNRNFHSWAASRSLSETWLRLPGSSEGREDYLAREESAEALVFQLLDRYGIISPSLCEREGAPFSWKKLLPTLKRLEFSGEVVCGQFVTGLRGLHFLSFAEIISLQNAESPKGLQWINSCDPASPCGLSLDTDLNLPRRHPSNWIILNDGLPVFSVRNNGLHIERIHTGGDIRDCIKLFEFLCSRASCPLTKIKVRTIEGQDVLESGLSETLLEAGMRRDGRDISYYPGPLYSNKSVTQF